MCRIMRQCCANYVLAMNLDAEALAAVFGLRKSGRHNWNGPCPLCGGRDRFHVSERNGRVLLGCRGCVSKDAPNRDSLYRQMMQLARDRVSGRIAALDAPAKLVVVRP